MVPPRVLRIGVLRAKIVKIKDQKQDPTNLQLPSKLGSYKNKIKNSNSLWLIKNMKYNSLENKTNF